MPPLSDERAQATRAVRQALEADPFFSPLPEVALSREALLGEGGMGIVHLVFDRRLGRRAALKLVKGDPGEARMRRFLREAIVTARLDHPGIPPVFDAGRTASGQAFILMRYVAGRSLGSILQDRTQGPPLHELLGALVKVSEAVAYAHSRGVVHRDLKPANIMLGAFGEVLVMDWGIARILEGDAGAGWGLLSEEPGPGDSQRVQAGLTNEGAVLGTLGYIPPEQARGEDLDGRADVFALGAILTEILTGEPAVTGKTSVELLSATVSGTIRRPRERDRSVPLELDAIAAKALAPDRDHRYEDARAFAADITAYLEGRPVSVYREGPLRRAGRFVREHPALVTGVTVALVLSVGAAVEIGLKNVEIRRTNAELESALTIERARKLLADARTRLRLGAPVAEVQETVARALERARDEAVLLEAGRVLADAGDRDGARKLLRTAADQYPDSLAGLFELHQLDAGSGRFTTSGALKELLARARAKKIDSELVTISECYQEIVKGNDARAIELADRAIARAPRFAPAWIARSHARRHRREHDLGLADANRAVELAPDSELALDARAVLECDGGDLDASIRDADAAVRLAPGNSGILMNRGVAREQRGDLAGAIDDLTRATKLDPGNYIAFANLASALDEKGDFRGALEAAERAVALAPEYAPAIAGRGQARLHLGETAAALADLERAIQVSPECWLAYQVRGTARARAGDLAAALGDFDQVLKLRPDLGTGWYDRGTARMIRGDVDGALADFDRAVPLMPRSPDPLRQRAAIRLARGEVNPALEDLDRAVTLQPDDPILLASRGQARSVAGDLEGACRDFDRALSGRLDPSFRPAILVNRGIVRMNRKDPLAAIEDFTTALGLDSNLSGGWLMRARAREQLHDPRAADDYERALKLPLAPADAAQARKSLEALRAVSR
ncbi:MAG TPA: tetratricopeptide repeat protein [Planctomycetota bacterium]|nr:tetratricopeptide repeat protein [Planctomycetota bacterium]